MVPTEARLGLFGGGLISLLLAGLVTLKSELALGLSLLRYGIQAGTVPPDVLSGLRPGVVFLLPGLAVGLAVGYVHHRQQSEPPSRQSQATLATVLTFVPIVLTILVGLLGFTIVFAKVLVDGGIAAALTLGVFFGALVFAIALGGGTVMLLAVGVPAVIGIILGGYTSERTEG